ncbi:hypothetical protein BD560DRAFT_444618 [Blakeslea trispora]|nr:hypothetical protein BD560DRAFT_444618 [Blakeslea trispora]
MIISSIFHPAVLSTGFISSIIFLSWFRYWHKNNLARTERERAYVCTLLSSSLTSLSSIPLVITLITHGGDLHEVLAYRTWTVLVTTFFMTFLVMDLSIGIVFYRNKIELLTGWIHHLTYLATLTWAIHQQYTGVFVMMCCLELPTFVLALGSVRSQLRRDYVFAAAFLLTRIIFHMYAMQCAWTMQSFGPVFIALSAFFPVHCFWFYGFIKQQIRLARNKKTATTYHINTTVTNPTTSSLTIKEHVTYSPEHQTRVSSTTSIKSFTRKKLHGPSKYMSSPFHQSPPVSVH